MLRNPKVVKISLAPSPLMPSLLQTDFNLFAKLPLPKFCFVRITWIFPMSLPFLFNSEEKLIRAVPTLTLQDKYSSIMVFKFTTVPKMLSFGIENTWCFSNAARHPPPAVWYSLLTPPLQSRTWCKPHYLQFLSSIVLHSMDREL